MGTVYLGEHVSIGSRVAVKVLHEHLARYPELVQRFHAEARAVNLIGHENIVSIFDLNAAPPRPYLIMEYLEGVPPVLARWGRRCRRGGGSPCCRRCATRWTRRTRAASSTAT